MLIPKFSVSPAKCRRNNWTFHFRSEQHGSNSEMKDESRDNAEDKGKVAETADDLDLHSYDDGMTSLEQGSKLWR